MMEGRHEKVISALLSTNTREEAAKKLGINSRTIRRYFTDPEFLERYNEAAKAIIGNSTQQIQKSLAPAISESMRVAYQNTLKQVLAPVRTQHLY